MARRESYSGDLARVAQRANHAPELASMKSTWRAPRPASWPPPLPAHRVPVPPPLGDVAVGARVGRAPFWPAPVPPAPRVPAQFAYAALPPATLPRPVAYRAPVAPVAAQTAPHTLAPQVVRAAPSWRELDVEDNPFARHSRRRRWRIVFMFLVLTAAAVTVARIRPQIVPPAVARYVGPVERPVERWLTVVAGPAVAQARAFVVARVAPTPHGEGLAQSQAATGALVPTVPTVPTPPTATEASAPAVAAAPPVVQAAPPVVKPASASNEPPVVDISALPVARSVAPPPVAARPAVAPRPAPLPMPAPHVVAHAAPVARTASPSSRPPADDSDEAPPPKVAAKTVAPPPPPPVNTAPPPAPGSLDDLIRKAVEAESKKKH
jgi:hypothetical protein